ncbi:hypothetical protein E4U42_007774 [Claviceps africana]|uniref:Uncharacterized protein n=1 Tax=Claviceps africana TaxID=83212 RepID=A0A8K0NEY7_9HYPO|nr:hypothetical protein E4U42_007774 [Claviceps africana]
MTLSSSFHMPGAFHTDSYHQGLFRPPASSASSSAYVPPSRSSGEALSSKRKRAREDIRHFEFASTQGDGALVDHGKLNSNNPSTLLISPAGRHVAQSGRSYILAGQLNTPCGGPADGELLAESVSSDTDYRKALGSRRSRDDLDAAQTSGPTSLFHLPQQPKRPSPGWSTLAFSTLGGVVGKMWEFCKAGAFKGFHAGGGRGFEPSSGQAVLPADGATPDLSGHSNDDHDGDQDRQRIPGHFPEGDCFHDQEANAESRLRGGASNPLVHSAKRRQTAAMGELGRNWIVVKDQEPSDDTSGSPTTGRNSYSSSSLRNRNQGPSAVTGRRITSPSHRRASGRLADAAPYRASPRTPILNNVFVAPSPSTVEHPRPTSSASFASPRFSSPTKPAGMTPTIAASIASPASVTPTTPRGHRRRRSTNSSPQILTHGRTQSSASTASSRGAADDVENSPRLTSEAKQLAARRQREERDTDVKIAAFNKQLKDMIRQGKEALGTTIEVDNEGVEDGGWEDY